MRFDQIKAVVAAFLFSIVLTQSVWSQQAVHFRKDISYQVLVERSFGQDQNLVNGIQYFNRYYVYKGVPYFMSLGFIEGELTIQEKVYKNLMIRYDLLAQNLEIEYDNNRGGIDWMLPVIAHVTAFKLGEYLFEKLSLGGPSGKFYQVIKTEMFTCYIHWTKNLSPIQFDPIFTHGFTNTHSTTYLKVNGEIHVFTNRKGFVKLFPESRQKVIKRFLKRNHFNFQNASPDEMVLGMNAVANLLKSGGLP